MNLDKYIDIPFKELGRDLSGWDCWGCLRYIYQEQFGIPLPSYLGSYETTEDREDIAKQMMEGIKDDWTQVPISNIGDGILFRIQGDPTHVAIAIGMNEMIHTYRGVDTCIENFMMTKWRFRLLGFYRHKDRS